MASVSDPSTGRALERTRRVLIFAYYFPPMGLSGVQRTLKFAKYLSEYGWEPTVLTCEPGGYFAYDRALLEEVEREQIAVVRTRSWDPTRLFGGQKEVSLPAEPARRTLSFLSQLFFIPDNKIGWWWPARRRALQVISERSFDLLFSTAPPYTSHLIAADVAKSAGLPLVLDFRDDWLGNPRHQYPTPLHRSLSSTMERRALSRARWAVAINDIIRRNLLARNTDILSPTNVVVIPQGYDPADFASTSPDVVEKDYGVFTLLYSGVFYDVQTPEPFLRGLADLVTRRPELKSRIRAVFVGLLPESAKDLTQDLGVDSMIHHTGYVPHNEAVAQIKAADALWMMVGRAEGAESISTSKLYEYFGARKPILGIVPDGAAKSELQRYGAAEIADPDMIPTITAGIERLYNVWEESNLPEPDEDFVKKYDRKKLTRTLAALFDGAVGEQRSEFYEAAANL